MGRPIKTGRHKDFKPENYHLYSAEKRAFIKGEEIIPATNQHEWADKCLFEIGVDFWVHEGIAYPKNVLPLHSEEMLWKEVANKIIEDAVFNNKHVDDTVACLRERFLISRKAQF